MIAFKATPKKLNVERFSLKISRDLRPFTIATAAGTDQQEPQANQPDPLDMPKLWNGVYNAQCGHRSPPDLMEAQPKLLPNAGPKRVDMAEDDAESPLEAILPPEQPAEQVCLLRDSPFRILRLKL
ncbi:uncharacterized protein Dmoj_GI12403 [Drosophila mojavensis]|uniref:Uncharacterized protein n=1 Tax=Drosophila mojavensis TaxID=7230 RepID=B4KZG5_DROMO|nr:uncharacterized protein Dmoj_GI12403 [Drosophila mojavensis]